MVSRLLLVGGFLGAGKTTLLGEAARRLSAAGRRVGLITNDQAPNLVDTGLLARQGMLVQEVAGSCFCCDFAGLMRSAARLRRDVKADVLIAEPVGSCTDLSATILQPLKDRYARELVLAPLSVLADPVRLREVLAHAKMPRNTVAATGRLHDSAAYIFRKQLEEADIIVLNKVDLFSADEIGVLRALAGRQFPAAEIHSISALTGAGVEEWLAAVMNGGRAGRTVIDVDYDTYAEGEAVLGWLNAAIRLAAPRAGVAEGVGEGVDWRRFGTHLIERLRASCQERNAEIGHIKLLLSAGDDHCTVSLTSLDGTVSVRGSLSEGHRQAALVLNARAQLSPRELERLVRLHLDAAAGEQVSVHIDRLQSLSPGRPRPTHRYSQVIPIRVS